MLCVATVSVAASFLSPDLATLEGAGLKPIGHYAIVESNPSPLVRIGRTSVNHIVVPDPQLAEEAALAVWTQDVWRFSTAAGGGMLRAGEETASGTALDEASPARLQRGAASMDVSVAPVADIAINAGPRNSGVVRIPLIPGRRVRTAAVDVIVCTRTAIRVVAAGAGADCAPGSATTESAAWLHEDATRTVGPASNRASVTWEEGNPAIQPLHVTFSRADSVVDSALLWPGGWAPVPELAAVLSLSGQEERLRLHSTLPQGEPLLVWTTSSAAREISNVRRQHGDLIRIGRDLFVVRTAVAGATAPAGRVLALYRTQGDFWRRQGLSLAALTDRLLPLISASSPQLYQPYRRIQVPDCGANQDAPALWLARPPRILTGESAPPATPFAQVTQRFVMHALTIPAWLPPAARGRGVIVCRQGASFTLTGVGERQEPTAAPLDLVFRGNASTPEFAPVTPTITLAVGDVIYVGGQIFELADDTQFGPWRILRFMMPFTFALTALPLAFFLGIYQTRALAAIAVIQPREDRFFRQLTVLAPGVALAALVGLMTIGGVFQLRLAADSRLIGRTDFFVPFVAANLAGLVLITGLMVYQLTTVRDRTSRALRFALTTAALAAGLLWIDLLFSPWSRPPVEHVWRSPSSSARWTLALPAALGILAFLVPYALSLLRTGLAWLRARAAWVVSVARRLLRAKPRVVPSQWDDTTLARRILETVAGLYRRFVLDAGERPLRNAIARRVTSVRQGFARFLLAVKAFGVTLIFFALPGVAIVGALGLLGIAIGKEAAPALIVLGAALVFGKLSHFVQDAGTDDDARAGRQSSPSWKSGAWTAFASAGLFATMLLLQSLILRFVYEPSFVWTVGLPIFAILVALSVSKDWYPIAVLLRTAVPFFGLLVFSAWWFGDVGAVLTWAWTLSIVVAWTLTLNAFTLPGRRLAWTSVGAVLGSLVLIAAPFIGLSIFNALSVTTQRLHLLSVVAQTSALQRGFSRFALIAAPFYFDTGEWLARTQLIAADEKGIVWLSNLQSDLALNGLHHLLPRGVTFFAALFVTVSVCLTVAFAETYRRAANSRESHIRSRYLSAAFVVAVALFGLGMLLLVHMGASVFDRLPLTGVPSPWLSNSNVVHALFMCLVMNALARAARIAPE